jgi:hypothetical protein
MNQLQLLLDRLRLNEFPSLVLLDSKGAAEYAACLQELERGGRDPVYCMLTSAAHAHMALRAAIDWAATPSSTVFASLGASGRLSSAAAAVGCRVVQLPADGGCIKQLVPGVLQAVASCVRQQQPGVLCVGYIMKASREAALCTMGMLPLRPLHGAVFAPVDMGRDPQEQLHCDVLLHKLTDSLVEIGGRGDVPAFDEQALRFLGQLAMLPYTCIVDPLHAVRAVMDR